MRFKIIILAALFFTICSVRTQAQYTEPSNASGLTVGITVVNECENSNNGYITFEVLTSVGSEDATLFGFFDKDFNPIAAGVPLPFGMPVSISFPPGSLTQEASPYQFIIQSTSSGGLGGFRSFVELTQVSITKVTETDNTTCNAPDGQVEASISDGSLGLGTGSF
ncbi:MAG: hypothetical protein RLO12_12885, partial [Fulvivirga sp.]